MTQIPIVCQRLINILRGLDTAKQIPEYIARRIAGQRGGRGCAFEERVEGVMGREEVKVMGFWTTSARQGQGSLV